MSLGIGSVIGIVAFLFAAPVLGCLLAGIDRKLSAGLQGRVGPKLLQPYYDFRKLLDKEDATVNGAQDMYVLLYLVFIVLSGVVFFAGGNFLLCVFISPWARSSSSWQPMRRAAPMPSWAPSARSCRS